MIADHEWLKIKENRKIITKDINSKENGYLIDILNKNDDLFLARQEEAFQQFYMTTVIKGSFKGLHVHPYKIDTIFVPHGKICLVVYTDPVMKEDSENLILDPSKYEFIVMGEGNWLTVSYPSKYPHGFWGIADESIILNYRFPAWNPQDTHQFDIHDSNLEIKLKSIYQS
jgi:dTDP-4-dehydrorhamnose 3,5-epimerase-like enzyme